MFKVEVVQGKQYLLRIINAALNPHLFFKIANHNLTVVALDAAYTTPYVTEVVVLAPGQTVDAILDTNQPVGSYYMASLPYNTAIGIAFTSNLTTALLVYRGATSSSTSSAVLLPKMTDTATAHKFFSNITGLVDGPHWTPVPIHVDVEMFITMGLGLKPCPLDQKCPGPYGKLFGGSLNNRSFVYPETLPLQAAYFYNVFGVYSDDFPNQPPAKFDYTNIKTGISYSMLFPERKTSVKTLKFNSTVEIVLQNTALITTENHPMHLHGFNFHVLAQGFGNYNSNQTATMLNLVNPQIRNTIAVPTGGWAVLRFVANNPGQYKMC